MLRPAILGDTESIKKLLVQEGWSDDRIKIYMNHILNRDTTYVWDDQNMVTGFSYAVPKVLSLHGKRIKASYIVTSTGDSAYMDSLISKVSKKEFITLIQTGQPRNYESYGFETVLESYEYNINASHLPEFSVEGIVLEPDTNALVRVYERFTQHFTGYFVRDVSYFQKIKETLSFGNGGLLGIADGDELVGYIIYENRGNVIYVRECCYQKSGQLLRLLSFASRGKSRLIISVSMFEHIERILPDAKRTKHHFMMARINDKQLFERLFHIKIISAYSGFNAFGKPLWNRDFY